MVYIFSVKVFVLLAAMVGIVTALKCYGSGFDEQECGKREPKCLKFLQINGTEESTVKGCGETCDFLQNKSKEYKEKNPNGIKYEIRDCTDCDDQDLCNAGLRLVMGEYHCLFMQFFLSAVLLLATIFGF